jgi:hypothetical protein
MEKWADYCISNVRHNSSKTHIEEVKVRQDLGDSFGVLKYGEEMMFWIH